MKNDKKRNASSPPETLCASLAAHHPKLSQQRVGGENDVMQKYIALERNPEARGQARSSPRIPLKCATAFFEWRASQTHDAPHHRNRGGTLHPRAKKKINPSAETTNIRSPRRVQIIKQKADQIMIEGYENKTEIKTVNSLWGRENELKNSATWEDKNNLAESCHLAKGFVWFSV